MKLGQQIPQKSSQHGKGSVKTLKSERHKAYLTVKPQEWGEDEKKLKGFGKKESQTFDDNVYILKGTEGPEKFVTLKIDIRSTVVDGKEITKISHWYNIFNNILECTTGSTKIFV